MAEKIIKKIGFHQLFELYLYRTPHLTTKYRTLSRINALPHNQQGLFEWLWLKKNNNIFRYLSTYRSHQLVGNRITCILYSLHLLSIHCRKNFFLQESVPIWLKQNQIKMMVDIMNS